MAKLGAIAQSLPKLPGRTLILEPWVFADDWENKPKSSVCVGLRLMSDGSKSVARAEAERLALELHPKGGIHALEAFNDALMRQCVAHALCSPNNVETPSEIFPIAEEQVRFAITSEGAKFVFEAVLKYEVETSPLSAEATDAEIEDLPALVGLLKLMQGERAKTARRFLRYAIDEIREASGA